LFGGRVIDGGKCNNLAFVIIANLFIFFIFVDHITIITSYDPVSARGAVTILPRSLGVFSIFEFDVKIHEVEGIHDLDCYVGLLPYLP
jgi:hypothetical protein